MFKRAIKIFTLFGFTVRVDPSWLIIGLLVTWSLASGVFPQWYPDLDTQTYWLMGVAGALGLFGSIVWHECWHSLIARRYGLPIRGITLFIFGGVAEMNEEPETPKAEFFMALAGPVSSIVLGFALLLLSNLSRGLQWPQSITGAVYYMAFINLVLAVFNLIPGFPLDGGRLLRSALWHWKKNMRWATRISSQIGMGLGTTFIILGVLSIISGMIIGGIWYCLIGLFLRNAAGASYQQLLLRQALGGERVANFMTEDPVSVPPDLNLRDFVEKYVYRYHHKLFPVLEDGRLIGYITTRRLKEIDSSEWGNQAVGEAMLEPSPEVMISPEADAMNALSRMNSSRNSRLLVAENGQLRGIITLKDLLDFFSLKVELEEGDSRPNIPRPPFTE